MAATALKAHENEYLEAERSAGAIPRPKRLAAAKPLTPREKANLVTIFCDTHGRQPTECVLAAEKSLTRYEAYVRVIKADGSHGYQITIGGPDEHTALRLLYGKVKRHAAERFARIGQGLDEASAIEREAGE